MNIQKPSTLTVTFSTTDVEGNVIAQSEQDVFVYVDGVKASPLLVPTMLGNGIQGTVPVGLYIPDVPGDYSITATAVKRGYTLESIETVAVIATVEDLDDVAPDRPTDPALS